MLMVFLLKSSPIVKALPKFVYYFKDTNFITPFLSPENSNPTAISDLESDGLFSSC